MLSFLWENSKKEKKQTEDLLRENPLFESLSQKELKLLNAIVHPRSFVPGEFVFKAGKGLGMYIITSGKIQIFHNKIKQVKKPSILSQLKPGDFFGELCLAQEEGYHFVSAQAIEDCNLLGFFRPDLLNLIEKNPVTANKILLKLSSLLAERLNLAGDKLSQLSQST